MLSGLPSREVRRRSFQWPILGVIWLCSCATEWAAEHLPQPPVLPPEHLLCDRDADCEIVQDECGYDSGPGEPYAISHAASARLGHSRNCEPIEIDILYAGPCHTEPQDWTAVCSSHVCKRRKVHFFTSPEVHCPRP